VVTGLPGILLIVKTADCLPVLLVDPGRRVVAAVHCGWKGTLARLLEKTVAVMSSRCGSHPASLLAALGPCIGADCYEVGPEVREHFLAAGFPSSLFRSLSGQRSRYLFDLRGANLYVLRRLGVPAQKIFSANVCTHCAPRLPSYRRDRQKAGRMLSFIGISV
jgi:YfiH family protein